MSTALEDLEAQATTDSSAAPITLDSLLTQAEAAGYPQTALEKLRSHANLLQRTVQIAQIDVDAEVGYVHDHLPELRRARAQVQRLAAENLVREPAERQARLNHAHKLEQQAGELSAQNVDERWKARALVTELSIRLSARLRQVQVSTPEVDPTSLRLFERTMRANTASAEASGFSKAEAQHAARLAFLQAMVETEATPDDPAGLHAAIAQYRKNTTKESGPEPGHLHDVPLPEHEEKRDRRHPNELYIPLEIEDIVTRLESREESQQAMEVARLSRALSLAAAADLSPRQFAIYHVLAENTHLFDWRLDERNRLLFQKREGVEKGENIAHTVMREVGGFSGKGAAYRAVHDTLDRLGEAFQKYGRDATIEDVPSEKRTQVLDRLTASPGRVMGAARTQRTPHDKARSRQTTMAKDDVDLG
ncbi:hypothetical protein ACQUQQ_00905 [Acidithiobacillus ferrooxidans]|uniref:hypothetical protein n=1 Tax=Acidithiobacillus TaxID=119977 RepID=UPI000A6EF8B5|nr:hypothetical protein [Acidithiobacillus ferridurans]MBU2803618.1 hypothetical protein [Acidithiobacillus ferridurans]